MSSWSFLQRSFTSVDIHQRGNCFHGNASNHRGLSRGNVLVISTDDISCVADWVAIALHRFCS